LKVREKNILFRAVAFGSVLFFIGVAFCYFLVAGIALLATVQFSEWLGFSADQWRAESYITFMCRFMLGMGLAFELPVVILTLVKIELLDYERLVKFRSYAIIGNLVLAAFATPSGDPFTMFLMAIPLQLLYEISVIVAWYWQRKARNQAAMAGKIGS
jgi:sec-independent protein translocase protein TatC